MANEPANPAPTQARRLLGADEPAPVLVTNGGASSPFLIVCDHAGRRIPQALGTLGLQGKDLTRHIAWDIGIDPTGRMLGDSLGATVIRQRYSRLVVDCNRRLADPSLMPQVSDGTAIPGNAGLSPADREARLAAIYEPYHRRIAAELDRRLARNRPSVVISLHSFTPVYAGRARPWHAGALHAGDSALSRAALALLRAEPGLVVGDNQPYRMDETDHSVPLHATRRGLDYLELEIRQDLIGHEAGQRDWAARLARMLPAGLARAAKAKAPCFTCHITAHRRSGGHVRLDTGRNFA